MAKKGIVKLILESLQQFEVGAKYLREQGYNEAVATSGK